MELMEVHKQAGGNISKILVSNIVSQLFAFRVGVDIYILFSQLPPIPTITPSREGYGQFLCLFCFLINNC